MRRLLIVMLAMAGGCMLDDPYVQVDFNARTGNFRLVNYRDTTIKLGEVDVSKNADGTFSFKLAASTQPALEITDLSSPVMEVQVKKMEAFVLQQEAINRGLIGSFEALGTTVGTLANVAGAILRGSNVNLDTQWGSGSATLGTAATQPGG